MNTLSLARLDRPRGRGGRLVAVLLLLLVVLPIAARAQDVDPPQIRILEGGVDLADGSLFNRSVTPTVVITDASPVTSDALLNGTAFISGTAVTSDGSYELVVSATDGAGNSASRSVSFEIDTVAPVFGVVLPPEGSLTADAAVTLQGEVTGAVSLTVDGQGVSLAGTSFTAGPYTLVEGERTFSLLATDAAGNSTARTVRVVRDSTPPTVSLSQPASGAVLGLAAVDVVGSITDAHLAAATVTVNGVTASRTGGTFVARGVPLAEGPNTLTATATDGAGNTGQASATVYLDTLPPSLAILDPAPGTVVPGASLEISGTASDPHLDRVLVAGVTATLAGGSWSAVVPLVEGPNAVTAEAFDRLGQSAVASVNVLRDSTAPEIRVTTPEDGSYWGTGTVDVSGTVEVEDGLTVTVNGLGATVTGAAGTTGTFTASGVPLVEGENRLIARVVDSLGNQGAHTRLVFRDTVAPTVVSTDPGAGALAVPADARFEVTLSEAMASPAAGAVRLEVRGGAEIASTVTQSGAQGELLIVQPAAPLPSTTEVDLVLSASLSDRAGNPLAATTLGFTTADTVAPLIPVLAATPPARLCAADWTLAGTAEAGSRVRVTGGAAAAEARADAVDGSFQVNVQLQPDAVNLLRVTARDAGGNVSDPLTVQVIQDCVPPVVVGAERSGDVITVQVSEPVDQATVAGAVAVTGSAGGLAGTLGTAGDGSTVVYTAAAPLPAEALRLVVGTGLTDLAGNALAFEYSTVFGAAEAPSFLAGRVLNAGTGRPLEGARVVVASSDGVGWPEPAPEQTTAADGRFSIPVPAGVHYLMALRPGFTPVLRIVPTTAGLGSDVFDPRLQPASPGVAMTAASGGTVTGASGEGLQVPAGALSADAEVSVSVLEEQALPALLPTGWSPRGAVWIDPGTAAEDFLSPATLTLPVDLAEGSTATVVSLDSGTLQWRVEAEVAVSEGVVSLPASRAGGWAVVEPDSGSLAPPPPVVGSVLGASPAGDPTALLSATLSFDPAVVLPSQRSEVTAVYDVVGDLASGLPLTLSIREDLTLLDGTTRLQPPFEADLVLYRSTSGTPRSRLGLRPSVTAQTLPLEMGAEDVALRRYQGATVQGDVLGPGGGTVVTAEGDRVDVAPGALAEATPVAAERRQEADLPLTLGSTLAFLGALDVDFSGLELNAPATLTLELGLAPGVGDEAALFQVVDVGAGARLRPVALLQPTATGWATATVDPLDLPWPAVKTGGLFVFARWTVPVGFFRGTVTSAAGSALEGAVVSSAGLDWLQISGSRLPASDLPGAYVLPAPLATWTLDAVNPRTLNTTAVSATLTTAGERLDVDLALQATGPRLVSSVPADGAVDVLPGIEPTLQFSEPVDPSTAAAGIQLLTGGQPVPIDLEIQAGGLVRLRPRSTLIPGGIYEIKIATTLRDLQGVSLATPVTVSFTVQETVVADGLDRDRIFLLEPDGAGMAQVLGLAGAAPAGALVFAENTTRLATTESVTVAPDGSFDVSVQARVTDRLLFHVVITGQNEIVFEITPFLTSDGLGAHVDHRARRFRTLEGVEVVIPEGAFPAPAIVRLAQRPPASPAPLPSDFQVVAAFEVTVEGAEARKSFEVRLPRPAGITDPEPFLLARIYRLFGRTYWMLQDLMRDDGGELTTEPLPSTAGSSTSGASPVSALAETSVALDLGGEARQLHSLSAPALAPETDRYMPGVAQPGFYTVMATGTPLSYAAIPFLPGQLVFFEQVTLSGMAVVIDGAIERLLETDAVLLPMRQGGTVSLVGRDLTTGFRFFEGVLEVPTGSGVPLLPPSVADAEAPAPVAGSPLRFFQVRAGAKQEVVPGLTVELVGTTLDVRGQAGALEEGTSLVVVGLEDDVTGTAVAAADGSLATSLAGAEAGHVHLVALGAKVGLRDALEIEFDDSLPAEPEGVEVRDERGLPVAVTVIGEGRRLRITPPVGWQAGATNRLRLGPELADASGNAWGETLELPFEVEGSTVLPSLPLLEVRDVERLGSLLFVAAGPDGLVVVDASNPADLASGGATAYPWALGNPVMGLALDSHHRLIVVGGGVTNFGQVRIFDPVTRQWRGSTLVSDTLTGAGLAGLQAGKPRWVSILNDDQTDSWLLGTEAAPTGLTLEPAPLPTTAAPVTLSGTGWIPNRPVTLANLTRGTWSRADTDATGAFSVVIDARVGDRLELRRSLETLAYVVTPGVGIQTVDVDAFYNEAEDGTDSWVLGTYDGSQDDQLRLCGQPVNSLSTALFDVQTLFDPQNLHPRTLVGLVAFRGLALFDSDPVDPSQLSFFNQACLQVDGSTNVVSLRVVQDYPLDVDGDGVIESDELRDYIVVGHRAGGLMIFDAEDRDILSLVSQVPLPGSPGQIALDRQRRVLYVSGFGAGVWVVDFDRTLSPRLLDDNQDLVDDRILETLDVPGNTNAVPFLVPDLGLAFVGGLDNGLTGVAVSPPRLQAVVEDPSAVGPERFREVRRLAPLGVPTGPASDDLGATDLGATFQVLARLPGVAGATATLDVLSVGPAGQPVDGADGTPNLSAGDLADLVQAGGVTLPASPGSLPTPRLEGQVVLHRQADNPWEEGYNVYFSDPVVALADLRAARSFQRTSDELAACPRCDGAAEGVSPQAHEILSGHRLEVRLSAATRGLLTATYGDRRLETPLVLDSVPWDLAPSVRQEPTLNASLGQGEAAPGTLLHSGEMSHGAVDLAVRGRGLDFVFERTFRNQALGAGPLGPGWDHGYRQRLRALPNGDVEYFDGRGRRETFELQTDGTLEAPAGRFWTLDRHAAGFTLVDRAHRVLHFDLWGRLVELSDPTRDAEDTGNRLGFRYDLRSRLVGVVDSLNRSYTLAYDAAGRLTTLTDFTGREVAYEYDGDGRLTTVSSPQVTSGVEGAPPRLIHQYAYTGVNALQPLERFLTERDNLLTFTDPKGQQWLSLVYTDADTDGRAEEVTSQTWGGGTVALAYDFALGTTTVTDRRNETWVCTHNTAGQPLTHTDPTGATWTREFDGEGLETRRVLPLGREIRTAYGDLRGRRTRGNATSLTVTPDPRGANGSATSLVTTLEYDEYNNQPTRVVSPRGAVTEITRDGVGLATQVSEAVGSPENRTSSYAYNDHGQLTSAVNPNGHETQLTYFATGEARGYLRQVVVDPSGLALSRRFEVDARGNATAVIDERGVRHAFTFNELDWLVEAIRAEGGSADGQPPLGYLTRWTRDANGNVAAVERPLGLDIGVNGGSTTDTYTWGVLDELLTVAREIGAGQTATEIFTYDANFNLEQHTAPAGQVTRWGYDPRNIPTTRTLGFGTPEAVTESFAYNADRETTGVTDGRLNVWSTLYDGYGRPREARDPLGHGTLTTYDDHHNPVTVEAVEGGSGATLALSTLDWDLLDRQQAVRRSLWDAAGSPAGATDVATLYQWDPASNLLALTDAEGRVSTFEYDTAERPVASVDPAGNRSESVLDAAGNVVQLTVHEVTPQGGTVPVVQTLEYDALNRPVATTDALGNRTTTAWDARSLPRVMTDAEGFVTVHTYDGLDRRTRTEHPEGIEEIFEYDAASRQVGYVDAQGHRTTYAWDALDRKTSKTYPDGTLYTYTYDASHNVLSTQDANGTVVSQAWDGANRMTRRDVTLGPGVIGPTVETYAWDGLDRLTRAASGTVVTDLVYDSLSRVVSETTAGKTVAYTLDDVSNRTEMLYPSGLRVGRGYDPLDRVVTVGPESATPGVFDSAAAFDYRGPYLQAGKQLGNGLDLVRQFDPARRMLEETGHNTNDWLVYQERLGWSPRNLKTHQVRLDRTLSASTFGYDGASRVTIRSGDAVPSVPPNNVAAGPGSFQTVRDGEAYGLDSAQNLVTRQSVRGGLAGPVVPLTPDSSGRNRPGTLAGTPLTYDANGNLTAKGDLRFEYDFRNRLTRVLDSGGQELAAYEYDAFNRRVSKTVAGSRTDFVWSVWQVVEEYRDGNLSRRRLFGSGLDEIVFEQGDVDGDGTLETSYYPLYDSIGNLVALTGSDGTAFERYSYTPFGREQRITVDALPPAIRQLLLRGNEIRVDLTEEVVPEEVLDAVTDGRIRVEDTSTGTPLDLDVRFPSIPAPTPPQSTTGDVDQTSAASVSRTSAPALTASGVLTTTLDYQSDQQARRFALVLTTPPAAGTDLRLVITADALRDPFGNAATAGADQLFTWTSTETVLADTEPPAVHAVRVRQGYLEVEFDEEVDLATVPTGVTVIPTSGTALALNWSSLGDGFTVRTDETLPAGTFDLDIATTVQDLAGTTLASAYGLPFSVVNVGADLELFEAPDERIIPTSSVGNIHGFHGLPMDPETGLIYVRNRYYDPELGRFITADPLGYVDGPSMYGFAGYSPVNFGDPLGLETNIQVGSWEFTVPPWIDERVRRHAGRIVGASQETLELVRASQEVDEAGFGHPYLGMFVLQGQHTWEVYQQAVATRQRLEGLKQSGDEEGYRLELEAAYWEWYARLGEQVNAWPIFQTVEAVYQGRAAETPFEQGVWEGRLGIRFLEDAALVMGVRAAVRSPVSTVPRESTRLKASDFPEVASRVSQKQLRHIAGRPEHVARGGGFLNSVDEAQAVLDAYRAGNATVLGRTPQGFPVVKFEGVTGTNVNLGAGFQGQPTNVFIIKGTKSPSVVPASPRWSPR